MSGLTGKIKEEGYEITHVNPHLTKKEKEEAQEKVIHLLVNLYMNKSEK